MSVVDHLDLRKYCEDVAGRAKRASTELVRVSETAKNIWLRASAAALRERTDVICAANAKDLEAAPGFGLTNAEIDRLRLTPERIEAIAVGLEEIAMLNDPVGEVIESRVRPNGLEISKVRVP